MPLYEYQCQKCGHRFERIQRFSDPQVKKCPQCSGRVEQLLSPPAVQFKGSGWYVTDYARKSSPAASSDSGAKSDGGQDAGAKADTKTKSEPASKSTDKKASKSTDKK